MSVCFRNCLNYLSNVCMNVYWSNFRISSGSCHLVRKYLIQILAFWLGPIALQYRPCFWRTVYIPCSLGVSVRCLWTRERWSARLGYAEFFSPRPPQGRLHFSAYSARGVALPFIILFALTNKKVSYRRGTARCVVSIEILPIATQRCRNYLNVKSWPNRWYEVGDLVGGNAW